MNLDVITPKNQTEDLCLSITKSYEKLIKKTHTKSQETLEFKLTKPKGTFLFKPPIDLGLDSNWMIGLPSIELYSSIFNITTENNTFDPYTDTFDEF